MEILKFILAGLILGMPFGPVGILCMGKTIEEGRKSGFYSALGAVTVDVIYSVVVFYTLMKVNYLIVSHDFILRVIVGIFLMIVGSTKLFGKNKIDKKLFKKEGFEKIEVSENLKKKYINIFFISLPNVFNVVTIITIFTGLDIFSIKGDYIAIKLILGMFIGDSLLWFVTTFILGSLREKITEKTIGLVVKICGGLVFLFGVVLEVQAIFSKL
ncbi:MAG: LysE family transporter [Fusobacteriaceae bacterium]